MKLNLVNKPIRTSERGVIVCPVCLDKNNLHNHPIPDFRKDFLVSYSHFRGTIERGDMSRGKILLSDCREGSIICWFPVHKLYNTYYKLDWIEEAILQMKEAGIHYKYDIAFPGLGSYEDDGVDVKEVLKIIQKHFSDTDKDIDFHLNY